VSQVTGTTVESTHTHTHGGRWSLIRPLKIHRHALLYYYYYCRRRRRPSSFDKSVITRHTHAKQTIIRPRAHTRNFCKPACYHVPTTHVPPHFHRLHIMIYTGGAHGHSQCRRAAAELRFLQRYTRIEGNIMRITRHYLMWKSSWCWDIIIDYNCGWMRGHRGDRKSVRKSRWIPLVYESGRLGICCTYYPTPPNSWTCWVPTNIFKPFRRMARSPPCAFLKSVTKDMVINQYYEKRKTFQFSSRISQLLCEHIFQMQIFKNSFEVNLCTVVRS